MAIRKILTGLIICAGIIVSGLAMAEDLCANPVQTESGLVKGLSEKETNTCSWRGIPYAAAPVGELRWKAPAPAEKWDGIRDGSKWGARCVQKGMMEWVNADPSNRMSEDCLFLNIWRPNKEGKFPVMVWIHGGGYSGGTGNSEMYFGDRLSSQGGLVIVTINYRLNLFGFLSLAALREEDPNKSVGNYGSLDQVAALKWVQRNIEKFGGDKNNVTIFGESAGGWSICTMLATPLAKDTFHRAIIESGGCEESMPLIKGFEQGKKIAETLGCRPEDLDCLRKLSAKQVVKADTGGITSGFNLMNQQDGYLLTDTPLEMIRFGHYNWVPLMAGSNRDEVKIIMLLDKDLRKAAPEDYQEIVSAKMEFTDPELKELMRLYPLSDFNNSPQDAYVQLATDASLGCPTYLGLASAAKFQKEVYYYRFDFDQMRLGKDIGAMHAMELPFVFNSLDRAPMNLLYGPTQKKIAQPLVGIIQGYWINFARTGNPNGTGLPDWPKFDPADQKAQVLDTQVRTETAKVSDRCAFWDGYTKGHPKLTETMGRKQGEGKR